ncbi:hypothetical protein VTN77DRAFT_9211 [Rasamsonia byssochlamydoides]|uniref:uncharacterized protein n=1 Tax=Rasamsonia byssochlamydoides TaxID=89139 RepID=UPI0037448F6A
MIRRRRSTRVMQWEVTSARRVVRIGDLEAYLLWRNDAYNYWVMELAAPEPIANFTSPSKDLVIVKAGYLIRSAAIVGDELRLVGDVNATTDVEVISTPSDSVRDIVFNGEYVETSRSKNGKLSATIPYEYPSLAIPDLSRLEWKYLDSLPEIQPSYNDEHWTSLTQTWTNNPRDLTTPTSLYASDYGYHTGSLIYRGHFVANGHESTLFLNVSGGTGFAHSIWLNDTFLGSWLGDQSLQTYAQNLSFPSTLSAGTPYVLTILIDHMGQDEEAPGTDAIKFPRGILAYALSHHDTSDITWKMTGNLGGEQYRDLVRGPLNEGAMYAERQGYHLPCAPDSNWTVANPVTEGIARTGVGFYTTSFSLNIPEGYDVPMSFVFNRSVDAGNSSSDSKGINYRCQLYVNGYQFGKYVNNLGPQTSFPVPEGILNYNGTNYVAITLWALDPNGARIHGGLGLVPSFTPVRSGYRKCGRVLTR